RARIGTGYTLILPSDNEGDRISLAPLMPNQPQNGAAEAPQALIQRTVIRGRNGRPVVVERKLSVGDAKPAPAARAGKGSGGDKGGSVKPSAKARDAGVDKAPRASKTERSSKRR
ncbi:MAG: hypothetical protein LWW92_14190, partial [Rhodocyclales bacterium]|nr:hypothetical protein [Rhodocyclales bacterium]